MIFIRVLLPAPFSPSTAWISPGATTNDTSSFARTAGYCLTMPDSSSRTGCDAWPTVGIGNASPVGRSTRRFTGSARIPVSLPLRSKFRADACAERLARRHAGEAVIQVSGVEIGALGQRIVIAECPRLARLVQAA